MTKLSVNVNKVATLRNARGGNNPNVLQVAKDCILFGADGITVHPRPDERHIRYDDVVAIKNELPNVEFNIEGNPKEQKFIDLVLQVVPHQVTLVPDAQNQITSNHGWDTITNATYLKQTITLFKQAGIRTSIFVDPNTDMIQAALQTGTDRVELYTESYAANYHNNKEHAIAAYVQAATVANNIGLGINAGHDLDLQNLKYFATNIPNLLEVSIGHALICDALYLGLQNAVNQYKLQLGLA
jgi:pyridoxine 5-phosphate synthase